ncbi:hypothetical protein [Aliikangiella coralliicola]|uniref:Chemotaxis protein n=1 Tax=Aliikangiella coralliicola TaxID=2592383 RepID=A0A545UBU8_9GAMM|nr:hypothetical protein [Aliikangiella coralliicola]TQV86942.1 hypothetical protein FLL46_14105 [Aliikangiella coralliicola]
MAQNNDAADTFISVAHVASELFKAQSIAEELSITSKNARALAVRAGSTAAGFNEITRFIEGLSKLTIEAASSVNTIAISQTKIASDLFRVQGFISRLDQVNYNLEDGQDNELAPIYATVNSTRKSLERQIRSSLRELVDRLDETKMELRATQVVSVVSRVEASRAHEDFQNSLNSVADKVSSAGQRINSHLEKARRHLAHLRT